IVTRVTNFGGERMSKMRVYEYAKQRNLTSKEVLNHLKELKVDVSNHMSTITSEVASQLDEKLKPKKETTNNKSNKTDKPKGNKGNKGKPKTTKSNNHKGQRKQQNKKKQKRNNKIG